LLDREFRGAEPWQLPPLLRVGSWIGGDRDGNPFVDRDVLLHAITQQSRLGFEPSLQGGHELRAELSLSRRTAWGCGRLAGLAAASPDHSKRRADEPYRRVLVGVYARLAATSRRLGGFEPLRHPAAEGEPYPTVEGFLTELEVMSASLVAHGGAE